jgi:hypothetical protein
MTDNGTPRRLPVIPVDHVTHGGDYFACDAYRMSLSAAACSGRQVEANRVLRTKDRWMSGRGRLDFRHCQSCRVGREVEANVAAGPRRAVRADRRGSVVLPARTRALIVGLALEPGSSIRAVARAARVSPGTVSRAIAVGQVRRRSFNRLRGLFAPQA